MPKSELSQIARFVVVGLVNTALGYALFAGFFFLTDLSAPASNALSYLIVIFIALYLYRQFVFKISRDHTVSDLFTYLTCAAAAFSLNLLVLVTLLDLGLHATSAQIAAMAAYTVCFYLLNRCVVFRSRV